MSWHFGEASQWHSGFLSFTPGLAPFSFFGMICFNPASIEMFEEQKWWRTSTIPSSIHPSTQANKLEQLDSHGVCPTKQRGVDVVSVV